MKKYLCAVPLVLLFCFTMACQDKAAMAELQQLKAQAKVEEQNKALMLSAIEDWNRGSNRFFMENSVPDYAYYPPGSPKPMSREELDKNFPMVLKAFPDIRYVIEDLVGEGDKLAARFSFTGTHLGEYMGIPATGNKIKVTGLIISLIKDGKFVEDREETDALGMMQQLGMELKPIAEKKK